MKLLTNHLEQTTLIDREKGFFEQLYRCFPARFEEGSREMLELEEEFDPMHPQAWYLDGGVQKSARELLGAWRRRVKRVREIEKQEKGADRELFIARGTGPGDPP
jgi:hypothetical protein